MYTGAQSTTNTQNNGLISTTSGASGVSSMFKTHYNAQDQATSNKMSSKGSERTQELLRLKKEYQQMGHKEGQK